MHVHVFTTGGTIDKVYFDASSAYQVGEPQIGDIFNQANVTISFEVTTIMRKDSLDMTDADRAEIAEHVQGTDCERVLVTHGTDTMVRTAQTLQQCVTDKTVVFVGSLNPALFKSSDAVFNVGFALGALEALPPGIYIAMNGQIFDPERAHKNRDANRFERLDATSDGSENNGTPHGSAAGPSGPQQQNAGTQKDGP
jgi:L-asparaginase